MTQSHTFLHVYFEALHCDMIVIPVLCFRVTLRKCL